ncbi:hypothetical protein DFR28_10312 [Arenicella xantha]|uniref:Uncharacterized protein n=2 Tax=Arenicella xantha TaxID=644221 RepID=A0A395JHH4_9GAMM|nr:hypothetical protein DFR28_10312 [Arenicella xantha]
MVSYWINFIFMPLILSAVIFISGEISLYFLLVVFLFLHFIGERNCGKWQTFIKSKFGVGATAVLVMAAALSLSVSGVILYITWGHNPQCEFHCGGAINWLNWLPYGAISAFLTYSISYVIGMALLAFFQNIRVGT